MFRWTVLLAAAALMLGGCALQPPAETAWDGGTWNSVLGYHGPANAMQVGGPAP